MKNNLIFLLTLFSLNFSHAQDLEIIDSLDGSYEDQVQEVFKFVDLNQVPNGVLYEYGFPLQSFENFGGTLRDSNKTDVNNFGLAYASIYSMAIKDLYRLPDPLSYRQIIDQDNNGIVRLVGLHQRYYQLNPLALDLNLLRENNGQLFDVAGRTQSPYQAKELFLIAPDVSYIKAESLKLYFDRNLFYNQGKNVQLLELDFGTGYSSVNFNQVIDNKNIETGLHTIKIRISYANGSSFESHFNLFFEKPILDKSTSIDPFDTPDLVQHIFAKEAYLGTKAGATVYVSYACGHTSLQKPFIWCEGFNPLVGKIDNRLDFNQAVQRLNYINIQALGNKSLSQHLLDEGYDLVVVDYDDGGDYLQRNAYMIEEVIRWVNAEKNKNGSEEKNVIIGQSMGGMISRYALRRMEVNGEDHQTGTYISFDTGHLGTNMPLGVQYAVRHIAGVRAAGIPLKKFAPIIEDAEKMNNLPSSRQMLMYHADKKYNLGSWDEDEDNKTLHDQYYDEQNRILGMPQKCEILALANGSIRSNGGQAFGSNELVVHAKANNFLLFASMVDKNPIIAGLAGPWFIFSLGTNVRVNEKIWSVPNYPTTKEAIYHGKISARIFLIPIVYTNTTIKVKDVAGVDACPGGFAGFEGAFPIKTPASFAIQVFKLNAWSFTPTVSTLNYYGSTSNHTEIYNPVVSFIGMQQLIQTNQVRDIQNYSGVSNNTFFSTIGSSLNNTAHTHFNSEIAPFMLYHLVGSNDLSETYNIPDGVVYNFGKRGLHFTSNMSVSGPRRTNSHIDHSITVHDNGVLAVNHYGGIGFDALSTTGVAIPAIGHYSIEVKNLCGDNNPIEIRVKNGGKLRLGNGLGRKGEMHFYENTKLIIEDGGLLELNADANLVFHENSVIELQTGSKVIIYDGSRLRIGHGSTMYYAQGVQIISGGSGSELAIGGTIHLAENAVFELDHSASAESGYIRFMTELSNSPINLPFTGEAGSRINLTGKGKNDPFIIVENLALFLINDTDIESVTISNAEVTFEGRNGIICNQPFYTDFCTYNSSNPFPIIRITDKNHFFHSDFTNVSILAWLNFESKAPLLINSCKFTNESFLLDPGRDELISVEGMGFIIHNTDFNCVNRYIINSQNMTMPSSLMNCNLSRNAAFPLKSPIGLLDYSNTEIWVTNCNFSKLRNAITKYSGKLSLKCSVLSENEISNNIFCSESVLNMSTDEKAGYNTIENNHGNNIQLDATNINLKNGYNFIKTPGLSLYGSLLTNCIAPSQCQLTAVKNQWNDAGTTPPASTFELYSLNSIPVTVKTFPNNKLVTCGLFDGPYKPVSPGKGSGGIVELPGFIKSEEGKSHVPIEKALDMAILRMKTVNPNGNDFEAIEILNSIFTSTGKINEFNRPLLEISRQSMKSAIENAFLEGQLTAEANQNNFEEPVQKYVHALNKMSDPGVQSNRYKEQFNLEIEKSHLYRLIGKPEKGLELLTELEKCGLKLKEQTIVNHWKKQYLIDIQAQELGTALLDTIIIIDSSQWKKPVSASKIDFYFGSIINGVNDITYVSCNSDEKSLMFSNSIVEQEHVVYPNPAENEITINWAFDSPLLLEISDLSGKVILTKEITNSETIQLEKFHSGIYLYNLRQNDLIKFSGKIIKE